MNNLQKYKVAERLYEKECRYCRDFKVSCNAVGPFGIRTVYKDKSFFDYEIEHEKCRTFVRRIYE